jgi:hypothetical protein
MSKKQNQTNQQIEKPTTKSNMSNVIRSSNLEVSKIAHGKIQPKGKGKMVKMAYDNSQIRLQLPNARVPFGLSVYENDSDGTKKYSLEISVGGTEKLENFREQLEQFDDLNVNTIVKNSKAWLGETKSATIVREAPLYGSLLKPDKKGESPPRFKFKLPVWEGKPMFTVYDSDKQPVKTFDMVDGEPVINWDWAQNGMEITAIVECEGLWVVGKNVYCTWRAVQLKVTKKSSRITDYAFMDDEPAEKEVEEDGGNDSEGSLVDDSEDSGDESE